MTKMERELEEALERGVLDRRLIELQDARNAERISELFDRDGAGRFTVVSDDGPAAETEERGRTIRWRLPD